MELDALYQLRIPALESVLGLAVVRVGAREVDRGESGSGEAEGEVEELVEMALGRKGDYDYCDVLHCRVWPPILDCFVVSQSI